MPVYITDRKRRQTIQSKEKVLLAAEAVSKKYAVDVVVLNMAEVVDFTDYFLICSGESDVQIRAIADSVLEVMKEKGGRANGIEGYENGRWVLLDYVDVVVHIFDTETRDFYQIDKLWIDAPSLPLE